MKRRIVTIARVSSTMLMGAKCLAVANSVEKIQDLEECNDNPYYANCKMIVKAGNCSHKYYSKYCCKSCTLAGQL